MGPAAGDIDQLMQQRWAYVTSATLPAYVVAEHRLVKDRTGKMRHCFNLVEKL